MAKRSTRAPTLRKDRTGMSPVTVGLHAALVARDKDCDGWLFFMQRISERV